jgi:hypothetical protein
VSLRTLISSTPSTLTRLRFDTCGCNSLMRLASFLRCSATILMLSLISAFCSSGIVAKFAARAARSLARRRSCRVAAR